MFIQVHSPSNGDKNITKNCLDLCHRDDDEQEEEELCGSFSSAATSVTPSEYSIASSNTRRILKFSTCHVCF